MAKVATYCGGLLFDDTKFTSINKVLTTATTKADQFTPTYSTGVTADFNKATYEAKAGKVTKMFTATVADDTVLWNDGDTAVTISEYGITNTAGVVDGSTITITYAEIDVPRTELVGTPIVAKCSLLVDNGVFKTVKVNGKDVLTLVDSATVTDYFAANCSLLFDADVFELTAKKVLTLIA